MIHHTGLNAPACPAAYRAARVDLPMPPSPCTAATTAGRQADRVVRRAAGSSSRPTNNCWRPGTFTVVGGASTSVTGRSAVAGSTVSWTVRSRPA
ncbi:hypothetical protein AB0C28_17540 [Nonomuraea sp. NPDC048892]|uniref:hypothetical protein n=1 Tax=Nonomuraea sp. NPDC048892 TaxID=3154624 RepID=UPI0033FA713A